MAHHAHAFGSLVNRPELRAASQARPACVDPSPEGGATAVKLAELSQSLTHSLTQAGCGTDARQGAQAQTWLPGQREYITRATNTSQLVHRKGRKAEVVDYIFNCGRGSAGGVLVLHRIRRGACHPQRVSISISRSRQWPSPS